MCGLYQSGMLQNFGGIVSWRNKSIEHSQSRSLRILGKAKRENFPFRELTQ